MKFYWSTAILTHLHAIYSCLCAITVESRVATGTVWSAEAKVFINWSLIGKACLVDSVLVDKKEEMMGNLLCESPRRHQK
jgi:drug/metabolite transporter superfamily protein YnfA